MAEKASGRPYVGDAPREQGALPAVKARQGVISGRVLTVLLVSLVLVVLGFGAAYLYAR